MTRAQRVHVLRAVARLTFQARLNLADAQRLGRGGEAAAWAAVVALLGDLARQVHQGATPTVQVTLFGSERWEPAVEELGATGASPARAPRRTRTRIDGQVS